MARANPSKKRTKFGGTFFPSNPQPQKLPQSRSLASLSRPSQSPFSLTGTEYDDPLKASILPVHFLDSPSDPLYSFHNTYAASLPSDSVNLQLKKHPVYSLRTYNASPISSGRSRTSDSLRARTEKARVYQIGQR